MQAPLHLYLLILTSLALSLRTEARALARQSRNPEDILAGRGRYFFLEIKNTNILLIYGTVIAGYFSLEQEPAHVFRPTWQADLLPLFVFTSLVIGITGFRAAGEKLPVLQHPNQAELEFPLLRYALGRLVYLAVYEMYFRGVILYSCIPVTGMAAAVGINILFYALAHGCSGRREILGALPFGLLLCLVTLLNGSVWPAILLHWLLALGYEMRLIMACRAGLFSFPYSIIKK